MISQTTHGCDLQGQGAEPRRLELLRNYLRSVMGMARLVLDEVLAIRFENEEPD